MLHRQLTTRIFFTPIFQTRTLAQVRTSSLLKNTRKHLYDLVSTEQITKAKQSIELHRIPIITLFDSVKFCMKKKQPELITKFVHLINDVYRDKKAPRRCHETLHNLIKDLKENSMLSEAAQLLFLMKDPERRTLSIVLHGYIEAGKFLEIMPFVEKFDKSKFDEVTWNTIITGYVQLNDFETAEKYLTIMKEEYNVPPTTTSHNIILQGLLDIGRITEAVEYFKNMVDGGFVKDSTVKILINRIAEHTDTLFEVVDLLKQKDLMHLMNIVQASRVMSVLLSKDKFSAILKFYELVHSHFKQSAVMDTLLIKTLIHMKRLDDAELVFKQMKNSRELPDELTYTAMINAYLSTNEPFRAAQLTNEMINNGHRVFIAQGVTLLNSLVAVGAMEIAHEMLYELIPHIKKLGPNLFNAVIRGYAEKGDMDSALTVYEEMLKHVEPNLVTYCDLLHGYILTRNTEKVLEMMYKIKENRGAPAIVFIRLIQYFMDERMNNEIVETLEWMGKTNHIQAAVDLCKIVLSNARLSPELHEQVKKLYERLKDLHRKFYGK